MKSGNDLIGFFRSILQGNLRKTPQNLALRKQRFMYQSKFLQFTVGNFSPSYGGKLYSEIVG